MVIAGEPKCEREIDDALFAEAILARNESRNFVEAPDAATATEIRTVMTQQHKVLSILDRCWKVELSFWLSQCGPSGESRLKGHLMALFPTPSEARTLEATPTGLKKIAASKLFQFVGAGLQTEVTKVQTWVSAMVGSRNPPIAKHASDSDLYKQVLGLLPNFCRETHEGQEHVGRAALVSMLAKCQAKDTITLADLKPFSRFNWMLVDNERAHVKGMLQTVTGAAGAALEKVAPAKSDRASAASGSKAPPPKKRKVTDEAVLRAATKALFK